MTNKEKLEIIDEKLEELYKLLEQSERLIVDKDRNVRTYTTDITKSIYNLESTRLLLEEEENETMCDPIIGFDIGSCKDKTRDFNKDDPF